MVPGDKYSKYRKDETADFFGRQPVQVRPGYFAIP
jgi:hypothetical protein